MVVMLLQGTEWSDDKMSVTVAIYMCGNFRCTEVGSVLRCVIGATQLTSW